MRASVRPVLFVVLVIVAGACDGHMRRFYVREPAAPRPPWYEFATVVTVPKGADVHGVVSQVADELGMQRDSEDGNSYRARSEAGYALIMHVRDEGNSLWTVRLLDWPTTSRSELSRRAEHEIRTRLEAEGSNKPLQPT